MGEHVGERLEHDVGSVLIAAARRYAGIGKTLRVRTTALCVLFFAALVGLSLFGVGLTGDGSGFGMQSAQAAAITQPAVRVEVTNTEKDGNRKPVQEVEFGLRNDYYIDGTAPRVILPARTADQSNGLIGYEVVMNSDGKLTLQVRADAADSGGPKVLAQGMEKVRLIPTDNSKPDNLVDVKRWVSGTLTNANPYREKMEFRVGIRADKPSIVLVNELGMEQYLQGVVPSESFAGWPQEALKAQAVAARSYALRHVQGLSGDGFIDDTTAYQKYGGYAAEVLTTNQAVQATAGEVLTYQGSVINAYYSSSNGGYTELSESVWTNSVPYITSKPDPYDIRPVNPNSSWTVSKSAAEIQELLAARQVQVGAITALQPVKLAKSGRILQMKVEGTAGQVELMKEQNRTYFGLRSSLYTVKANNQAPVQSSSRQIQMNLYNKVVVQAGDETRRLPNRSIAVAGAGGEERAIPASPTEYTFEGRGFGHGVGMSQYGAFQRAAGGQSYREILQFYYEGAKLVANYNQ